MKRHPHEHGRTSGIRRSSRIAAVAMTAASTAVVAAAAGPGASAAPAPPAVVTSALAATSQGLGSTGPVLAASPNPYRADVVLVGFRSGASTGERYAIERAAGGEGAVHLGPAIAPAAHGAVAATGAQYLSPLKLRVRPGDVPAVIRRLRRNSAVAYAEPDYLMSASAAPSDPSFSLQWGDSNTGQPIPTQESEEVLGPAAKGTAGADDRAIAAWGVTTGSRSIVIGETDTGVDYTHPDLAANIWSNPGGIGGCASGTHGYNVRTHTCEPMDDDTVYGGHGTHVAGIMGAVGNNGTGVAGMNWQTSILPVKWLSSSASGETSGLIEALQWLVAAKQAGVNVRVVNDSATFVGTAFSQALSNEIDTLGANNILFVTAAGNTGNNNDEEKVRRYPCGYDRPTELCVTATNNNDQLPTWANYGPHTVDLAAPGVSIYSTLRKGTYGYLSGGSMASPQVAGAAALILSANPALSASELKADITSNVDPLPALAGKVITGGRLDVCKALPGCSTQQPPPTSTFGKTSVGASTDGGIFSDYKVVHAATLPSAGSVTKLSLYAIPGINSPSPQALRAVIYSDSGGSPGALLASGPEVTYQGSVNGSGWFELPLASPVALSPGTYWLGFITGTTTEGLGYRYDTVANSRAYNTNPFANGPTNPFGTATKDSEQASIYATYTTSAPPQLSPPANISPPTISGIAEVGQTLSAGPGSWSESPSSYTYQWQRCDASGASCSTVAGATAQTYTLTAADSNATIRVAVTASNSAGGSVPASSAQTAVVVQQAEQSAATFGKTNVGSSPDTFSANRKRVNRYALAGSGSVSKLSIYLTSAASSGSQALRGIVYADSSGKPAALLGSTETLTFKAKSAAGWYDLEFSSPLQLAAGNYWIGVITGATSGVAGFRYDYVSGSRDYDTNTFTAGPSDPFGAISTDGEQTSLYATYTTSAPPQLSPPANISPPTISGIAEVGQTLSAGPGSWSESPSSYTYQWQRCDASGASCSTVAGATAQTYTLTAADPNATIRVAVTASNSAGGSVPASSAQTAVVVQQAEQSAATFGKTNVGSSPDTFSANRKRVNRYALAGSGSVSKLSIYLTSAASSGSQALRGIVYADSSGKPAALLGSTETLTFKAKSAAGWYDLEFSSPLQLAAGNYWIGVITGATSGVAGFRYDYVSGSRDYDTNTFTAGPSDPFGAISTDGEQTSLYATYLPG